MYRRVVHKENRYVWGWVTGTQSGGIEVMWDDGTQGVYLPEQLKDAKR